MVLTKIWKKCKMCADGYCFRGRHWDNNEYLHPLVGRYHGDCDSCNSKHHQINELWERKRKKYQNL